MLSLYFQSSTVLLFVPLSCQKKKQYFDGLSLIWWASYPENTKTNLEFELRQTLPLYLKPWIMFWDISPWITSWNISSIMLIGTQVIYFCGPIISSQLHCYFSGIVIFLASSIVNSGSLTSATYLPATFNSVILPRKSEGSPETGSLSLTFIPWLSLKRCICGNEIGRNEPQRLKRGCWNF